MSILRKFFTPNSMKMVLVVRNDLRLSRGKIASQCAHAGKLPVQKLRIFSPTDTKAQKTLSLCLFCFQILAVACYQKALNVNEDKLNAWLKIGQPKIVVRVENLEELETIYKKAKEAKIIAEVIFDAGRTQVASGTATVLGLGPDFSESIDAIVKNLKLL